MITLCLAALLGALVGPLLAMGFASPILILTTPLFASLAALIAGSAMALVSQRTGARAQGHTLATTSVHAPAAPDTDPSPQPTNHAAGRRAEDYGASDDHKSHLQEQNHREQNHSKQNHRDADQRERDQHDSDQFADEMVAALRRILTEADPQPGTGTACEEYHDDIGHARKTG